MKIQKQMAEDIDRGKSFDIFFLKTQGEIVESGKDDLT